MDPLFRFRSAVLAERLKDAKTCKNDLEITSIEEKLNTLRIVERDREMAEIDRALSDEKKFLRYVGGRIIGNLIKLEVPKTKLYKRVISASPDKADSLKTVSNGWIMDLSEEVVTSGTEQTLFDGFMMNRSKVITGFKKATSFIEQGVPSYRVSFLGDEFQSRYILSNLHPVDAENEVLGELKSLSLDSALDRIMIQHVFVDTVKSYYIEI